MIDSAILRDILRHDSDTGLLYWKNRCREMFKTQRAFATWNARYSDKEAFTADRCGYKHGRIFNKSYQAHRVVWALAYGVWPIDGIDHINGNKTDNRLSNLRMVSQAVNMQNAKIPSTNTSGHIGVSLDARLNKWVSYIKVSGVKKHLGCFALMDDAVLARKNAETRFGFHRNHGRMGML